jgi:hypothetical protein
LGSKDADIKKAKQLVNKGELLNLTVGKTIKENIADIRKHKE